MYLWWLWQCVSVYFSLRLVFFFFFYIHINDVWWQYNIHTYIEHRCQRNNINILTRETRYNNNFMGNIITYRTQNVYWVYENLSARLCVRTYSCLRLKIPHLQLFTSALCIIQRIFPIKTNPNAPNWLYASTEYGVLTMLYHRGEKHIHPSPKKKKKKLGKTGIYNWPTTWLQGLGPYWSFRPGTLSNDPVALATFIHSSARRYCSKCQKNVYFI